MKIEIEEQTLAATLDLLNKLPRMQSNAIASKLEEEVKEFMAKKKKKEEKKKKEDLINNT